ncbi:sodium-dependent bicarbonate transport family permease [Belliella aquatica]|uniref:Sodium-dependent bicarbonate transport family permease n=1 Tax=Belliella aquatica TaxID=1323734 RepID=A0ABQ1M167_9BACT|nr:sodium-dependent bicarbonate transport family permease [Belliella aquatica]MCH7404936.1 sodium-dependent bicarbonate transport family permease [Belliella aquatica]GGC32992.1 sodium-dependent bicarbonate transport family permease [Belliella aquatica]
MNLQLLVDNLTNPALLFFILGIIAVRLKSDLEIPANSSKFISLYLLFSIGFKGGQELAHSEFDLVIIWSVLFGILIASLIPIYSFFIIRKKVGIENAGAIAAAYGSVSAVTFVTAVTFLEIQEIEFSGYMVAIMALMEAPAIIIGMLLIKIYGSKNVLEVKLKKVISHAFTNGSVVMILGSLLIGFLANDHEAEGIKPFTTDIFKGFLAIFLLDMGISSGKKLKAFLDSGKSLVVFAIIIPLINGSLTALLSQLITNNTGDRFMFAILAASASYIAVPAAMKIAVPKANPGLFLPMALAVTFPINITVGFPIYYIIAGL